MNTLIKNKEFWKRVSEAPEYRFYIDQLKDLYEKYCKEDIPSLKFTEYDLFATTGDRTKYEKKYFARRLRLDAFAMLALIYPDRKDYLEGLEDTIWAICDEYTWAVPAHMYNENAWDKNDNGVIDLFASETGFALSEIYTLLKDRLAPLICSRIEAEIDRRIIQVYLSGRKFFFDEARSNWASVCASSIGITFMYMRPDIFPQIQKRAEDTIEHYFESIKSDGACREGLMYWNYGFGFFVAYADRLYDFTNGKRDYFKELRVKQLATFQQKVFLRENISTSFADCNARQSYTIGIAHYLSNKYPEDVSKLPLKYGLITDSCGRWMNMYRSLVWFDPLCTAEKTEVNKEYYLADSAWYISKKENYAFACKAGDNDEPHNHNDIGSFIVADDEGQILCDLGAGLYTRQYFSEERWNMLCCRSKGHSVPIINGKEQKPGKEFSGKMSVENSVVDIEFSKAYGIDTLKSCKRTFRCYDEEIIIKDSFIGAHDVKERFITERKAVVKDNKVIIGSCELLYDFDKCNVKIESAEWKPGRTAYLITFEGDIKDNFDLKIKIN